ncbi:hypothetical protein DFJ74DRAFT_661657 [Hyaloraphidium curvatum]|nr:hypothetical protein DFJ74DRAFT_661657 [Hyaloraphidium curvatum]
MGSRWRAVVRSPTSGELCRAALTTRDPRRKHADPLHSDSPLLPPNGTMSDHTFQCPCKALTVVAKGDPAMCLYCWCNSCQRSQSSPVEALGAWPEASTSVTGDLIQVKVTEKENGAVRYSCSKWGTRIISKFGPETARMAALFPPHAEDGGKGWFKPTMHIFCEDAFAINPAQIHDGLPKYVDVPKAWGGSDKQVEAVSA